MSLLDDVYRLLADGKPAEAQQRLRQATEAERGALSPEEREQLYDLGEILANSRPTWSAAT